MPQADAGDPLQAVDPETGEYRRTCMGCAGDGTVIVARMAIGPHPRLEIPDGVVATVYGGARCPACAGRGWTPGPPPGDPPR